MCLEIPCIILEFSEFDLVELLGEELFVHAGGDCQGVGGECGQVVL